MAKKSKSPQSEPAQPDAQESVPEPSQPNSDGLEARLIQDEEAQKKGVLSPFDGLLRENTYTPFALSDGDASIQYSVSENQVRIRWDPYSNGRLHVRVLDKNVDIEKNKDAFKEGIALEGFIGRKLAGYGWTAPDINSVKPDLDSLSIDDLTLKFNDPGDTNYYVLPFGKLSEEGKPVNVICDLKQLRAVALYYDGKRRPSRQAHTGLGWNIAPIVRWVGNQKEVTGFVSRVGSRHASGYAVIAVPDKTQINMVSPGGAVETVKGQVYAYTDNLDLKVLGVWGEFALTKGMAAAGGAAAFFAGGGAEPFLPLGMDIGPYGAGAVGFLAGSYLGNYLSSKREKRDKGYLGQVGLALLGGVAGAAGTYFIYTGGMPALTGGVLLPEGLLIGNEIGRLVSALAINPENFSETKRFLAASRFTDEKLHSLAMRNNSGDYGFCITS